MRRAVWVALVLGALAAAAWPLLRRDHRPNLVLISIDTLRQDRLGAYGYGRPTSPQLDALAARGVVFEHATAPSPWTVPSTVSLLTGLTPQSHGATGRVQHLPAGPETIATWLHGHGYETAAVVNSVLLGRRRGFANGFDHFDVVPEAEAATAAAEIDELALRWLEQPRDRPFFLFLHHYDVHSDYAPGDTYRELLVGPYAGKANGSTEQLKEARLGVLAFSPDDARHLSELYDAEIRQLDDELGRFLGDLRRRGLLEDTVLIVTSDHGEEFLEHGSVMHGRTLYGELVRVPLLIAGPGIPAGRRVAEPASLIDVFPTSMALLGVEQPPYVEGIDLWGKGSLHPPAERPVLFGTDWWFGRPGGTWKRAVQQGGWKLHYEHPSEKWELYDVVADPGEQRDLASKNPDRVASLRALLAPQLGSVPQKGPRTKITDEEAERLRALGYLE